MKIIYPEYQTSTGANASSEASGYTVSELFNDYPGELYKAADSVQSAFLKLPVLTTGSLAGLGYTNATTAEVAMSIDSEEKTIDNAAAGLLGVTVSIPCTGHGFSEGDYVAIYGTTNYDGISLLPSQSAGDADHFIITAAQVAETFAGTETAVKCYNRTSYSITYDRLWFPYNTQAVNHHIWMELTTTSATLQAGIFRAGSALTIKGPIPDFKTYPVDHSKDKELNDGGLYVFKRNIRRGFQLDFVNTGAQFKTFETFYQATGKNPFFALVVEDQDNEYYSCFGRIKSYSATHQLTTRAPLSFTFEEAN